jgi:glycosyltransferase involved in cell wall biosynthesis
MSDTLVTVVLPVYNGSKHLLKALKSISNQKYDRFEVVVCDDGSSDDSWQILTMWQRTFPRARLLRNEKNLGLFPTLNLLVRHCTTDLVRLFAQDDVLNEDCLEREVLFASQNAQLGMFYCARGIIDSNDRFMRSEISSTGVRVFEPWLVQQISFYLGSMPGNIANVTLRKSAVGAVGGFDESFKVSGDFEMWTRLGTVRSVGLLNEPLMQIRSHNEQFSQQSMSILSFMREDRRVYSALLSRLPSSLVAFASRYDAFHRGTFYMNAVVRLAMRGRFEIARSLLLEMRRHWSISILFFLWGISLNRRLFKLSPRFLDMSLPSQRLE